MERRKKGKELVSLNVNVKQKKLECEKNREL
jgi:hypothetical protein